MIDKRPNTGQHQIRTLLDRVRARWRRLMVFRATVRAALAAAGVLAAAVVLSIWAAGAAFALAALGIAAILLFALALAWGFWRVRRSPSDSQVARYIEESDPSLDDRLVSAVHLLGSSADDAPGLAGPMINDAARRTADVDPSVVVTGETMRRAGFQAVAAALLLAAVAFSGRGAARDSFDALTLTLFPSRVTLDVTPGNVRLQPGTPLVIEARMIGNRAPVVARVLTSDGADDSPWNGADMSAMPAGGFKLTFDSVGTSFKYRVAAGLLTSATYDVSVVRPPRVTRIDVDYTYPTALGLGPRTELDGGDIYAPVGTDVRLRIQTDREVSSGQLTLGDGKIVTLAASPGSFSAALKVTQDGSYRIAVADADGVKNPGETEYFIRTVEDRPPEVRILKPARDRSVTRLEEVDIAAEAEDDFGIDSLELVYAVRGSSARAVPLKVPRRATSVSGATTLYLEDLDVQPGDFVSYYVRARDLARGKRSSEARSDIFFLEVKPFEQEFVLAQSQAGGAGGGGNNRQIDDLIAAQKEVIVATWKLDRRAQVANGARSESDIKSVARAEAELKTRVEETSSAFRTSMMRDPRARGIGPGRGATPPPGAPRANQTTTEEDAMTAAASAMGKAVTALNDLKTGPAIAPEMDALNHLLRAQADTKQKQQISNQQAASGGGGNRSGQDLSSLFDRELQRQQQTNYETPTNTEQRKDANASLLDKISELARRQDELLRRQRDLAQQRERMTPEDLRRELEKLTREQSDLRQRAEDLAQQMPQRNGQQPQSSQSRQNSQGQPQRAQGQQQNAQGQQQGQQNQQGAQGSQSGGGSQSAPGTQSSQGQGGQMRAASDEMRGATGDLRRQDPAQASARGQRALDRLREVERQLRSASAPDEARRARGDLQMEARQLADAQRELESDASRLGQNDGDGMRRLAGEQERLAERARRLQQGLNRQSGSGGEMNQQAITDANRTFGEQRIGERMQQSADQMRTAAGESGRSGQPSQPGAQSGRNAAATTQREVARALDDVADRLASADGPQDADTRRVSDQLARAHELRERLNELTDELAQLGERTGQTGQREGQTGRQGGQPNGQQSGQGRQGGQPNGQQSGQQQAGQPQQQTGQPSSASQSASTSAGGTGQGNPDGGTDPALARLREEYTRKLQEARELLDQLRRDDNTFAQSGPGFTFEGQGMVLSAPGTESFKQDFSKWDALRKQATQALERAESSLSQRLQGKASRDRLAAGVDDAAPAEYQRQVDSYFKALATKPK